MGQSATLALAYAVSLLGGWFVAGFAVWSMRRTVDTAERRSLFRLRDLWVGFTERAIVTTLFIWAPTTLPAFIGGWVALKFAANWQRRENVQNVHQIRQIFLVGSAISISIAILGGLIASPETLSTWSE